MAWGHRSITPCGIGVSEFITKNPAFRFWVLEAVVIAYAGLGENSHDGLNGNSERGRRLPSIWNVMKRRYAKMLAQIDECALASEFAISKRHLN